MYHVPFSLSQRPMANPEGSFHHPAPLSEGDAQQSLADPRQAGSMCNRYTCTGADTEFGVYLSPQHNQPIQMVTIDIQPYSLLATLDACPGKPHELGSQGSYPI